ncbi:hypothetical protein LMH73_015610 [Vibrio splendidus]|nr:hypothetical protein [Vibrio splendidus]MCC4882908.1 hypothetical protein [Vibrio splendidus]
MQITKKVLALMLAAPLIGCGTESYVGAPNGSLDDAEILVIEDAKGTVFDTNYLNIVTANLTPFNAEGSFNRYGNYQENIRPQKIEELQSRREFIENLDISRDLKKDYIAYIDAVLDVYKANEDFENNLTKENILELYSEKSPLGVAAINWREKHFESQYEQARAYKKPVNDADNAADMAYQKLIREQRKFLEADYEKESELIESTTAKPFSKSQYPKIAPRDFNFSAQSNNYLLAQPKFTTGEFNDDGSCSDVEFKSDDGKFIGTTQTLQTNPNSKKCIGVEYARLLSDNGRYGDKLAQYNEWVLEAAKDVNEAHLAYLSALSNQEQAYSVAQEKLKGIQFPTLDDSTKREFADKQYGKHLGHLNKMTGWFFQSKTNDFDFDDVARSDYGQWIARAKVMTGNKAQFVFDANAYIQETGSIAFSKQGNVQVLNELALNAIDDADSVASVDDEGGTDLEFGEYDDKVKVLKTKHKGDTRYAVVYDAKMMHKDDQGEKVPYFQMGQISQAVQAASDAQRYSIYELSNTSTMMVDAARYSDN